MNLFEIVFAFLRRFATRLRPAASRQEPAPRPAAPAPVVVPAPRRPGPRTLAVIRMAQLTVRDGERLVAVLATSRAGRREFTLRCSADLSQGARAGLGLDAFERLLADAEQRDERVVLHVHDRCLMGALLESASAFPRIDLVATLGEDPLGRLNAASIARLNSEAVAVPAPTRRVTQVAPLRVGTDASKSRRRGVGVGLATERGEIRARFFAQTSDVLQGELQAIEFALDSYPGRPLVIESDSLNAVRYLTERSRSSNRVHAEAVARILPRIKATSSRVVWVRGHDGHDLNEAADRAARAARRQREFGLGSDWLETMLGSITADCFAAAA
ncbi:RNase H family protein [Nocardioides kribbensis]|uniref:RNase H family protein n=1 Tax=Nocardioides kribbensis TaxID=305517 RepID=A0ABV1NTE1_9ACTN